jgi:hypothetical protein
VRARGQRPLLGLSVITYLPPLFLFLQGNLWRLGACGRMGRQTRNAHFRSAPTSPLLTKELLAAGRRPRPLSNLPAHFSRDGVSLFQATVSNQPDPLIPGHCEMQAETVVFMKCQLRTVHPADPLSLG